MWNSGCMWSIAIIIVISIEELENHLCISEMIMMINMWRT